MNANTHLNSDPLHRDSAAARDPDSTIDRALSALRDAQPRPGLESRILSSLDHRTTTRAMAPGRLPFHRVIVKGWGSARENTRRSPHLALWTTTSAALLAIASLTILHHRAIPATNGSLTSAHPTTNAVILSGAHWAESKDPDTARRTTNPKPFSTTNLAQTTHTVSSRPQHRSLAMRSGETCISDHRDAGCPTLDVERQGGVMTTPTDAQALADLHTPSHPAPPLPLTPQEKLFLRMLRYGNATQLAELDPVVRAQHDAEETTEFKSFFPDPPPLKQPLGDTE